MRLCVKSLGSCYVCCTLCGNVKERKFIIVSVTHSNQMKKKVKTEGTGTGVTQVDLSKASMLCTLMRHDLSHSVRTDRVHQQLSGSGGRWQGVRLDST